jgi:hypothetical protein
MMRIAWLGWQAGASRNSRERRRHGRNNWSGTLLLTKCALTPSAHAATDQDGQRYELTRPDLYALAVHLAEQVGIDVQDGSPKAHLVSR